MSHGHVRLIGAICITACGATALGWAERRPPIEPIPASRPAVAQSSGLAGLAFMAGCWEGAFSTGTIEEHYTAPTGGVMLGTTRYLRDGRVIDFEFTKIEGDGPRVTLIPHPKGRVSAPFPARELSDRRAVFENPQHDFPQRIIYERAEDGGLTARIEGTTPAGPRSREWRMRRVPCPRA